MVVNIWFEDIFVIMNASTISFHSFMKYNRVCNIIATLDEEICTLRLIQSICTAH